MSVFADDLLLIVKRKSLNNLLRSIDKELKIVWGDRLEEGTGWVQYLGKECRCRNRQYEVRVPTIYWR
eukprot:15170814-Heterocapsa_arctica.AAC.1